MLTIKQKLLKIYQELSYDELKEALEKWVSGESEEDAPPAESVASDDVVVESTQTEVKQPKVASATSVQSKPNATSTEDVDAAFEELFKSSGWNKSGGEKFVSSPHKFINIDYQIWQRKKK